MDAFNAYSQDQSNAKISNAMQGASMVGQIGSASLRSGCSNAKLISLADLTGKLRAANEEAATVVGRTLQVIDTLLGTSQLKAEGAPSTRDVGGGVLDIAHREVDDLVAKVERLKLALHFLEAGVVGKASLSAA